MNEEKEIVNEKNNNSEFDGGLLAFIGWSFLGGLISMFSFGIAFPWAICMIFRWRIDHTIINGKRLKFNGTGGSLFITWLKWMFFIIITLGIYSLWIVISLEKWKVKNTTFAEK